jgi:hypothetical protein
VRLSLEGQKAVYAQETGDYPIILLTFTHPELSEPLYISTDPTERLVNLTTDENVVYGTQSNGHEYVYCPVEIALPSEEEDSPPQTQLSLSNIGREMVGAIRSLRTSPTVSIAVVLASDTNRIEGELSGFTFTDVEINSLTITGNLVLDLMTNEPFPYRTFTPSTALGLFKS